MALKEKKLGEITIDENRKNKEIISERGKQVEVPTHFSDVKKKALKQTGEEATQGW
jgi:hypothetical protein